jgi:hypothetical protein
MVVQYNFLEIYLNFGRNFLFFLVFFIIFLSILRYAVFAAVHVQRRPRCVPRVPYEKQLAAEAVRKDPSAEALATVGVSDDEHYRKRLDEQ